MSESVTGLERTLRSATRALEQQQRNGEVGGFVSALQQIGSLTPFLHGEPSARQFAKAWILQSLATEFLRNVIEDDYVDLDPVRRKFSSAVLDLVGRDDWIDNTLEEILRSCRSVADAQVLAERVVLHGDRFDASYRVAQAGRPLIPVSKHSYAAVPILEDSVTDPALVGGVIDAFCRHINLFRDTDGITCLCFIEKDVGPVGAIGMLASLVRELKLPACIYRSGYWSPHAKLAGHRPIPTDRVVLVYDLLVSGDGIREAADDLKTCYGVTVVAAIVLLAYTRQSEIKTADGMSIRIDALQRYDDIAGHFEQVEKAGGVVHRVSEGKEANADIDSRCSPTILSDSLARESVSNSGSVDGQGGPNMANVQKSSLKKNVTSSNSENNHSSDDTNLSTCTGNEKDVNIIGWENIESARKAVQAAINRTQIHQILEKYTLPFAQSTEMYPIRICKNCDHGSAHVYGQHIFEDGIVRGHITVCDECGHYNSRNTR